MPSHQITDEKRRGLVELSEGYGRILAGEAYGMEGPGLDVDLAGLEQVAIEMQRALLKGFCEATTQRQAGRIPETQPCPDCGAECEVEQPADKPPPDGKDRSRSMKTRGGAFDLAEPRCYCRSCRRSFFPSADRPAD